MGFDFEKMICAFEAVTFVMDDGVRDGKPQSTLNAASPALPRATPFLDAMGEVALLFDHLGSGFAFVRRDIVTKISFLREHCKHTPDLTDAVLAEIAVMGGPPAKMRRAAKTAKASKVDGPALSPSATRTLLRLMWATRFIDVLMNELAIAFQSYSVASSGSEESDNGVKRTGSKHVSTTLRDAVSVAYEVSLSEHHSWAIRRAVSAATYLLPSKEAFVQKLDIDVDRRDEFLSRINTSVGFLVKRMYAFYDLHDLQE